MGAAVLTISTFIFHKLEHWTWIEAFYYSVVTFMTVGYGDLTPSTDVSRLVASIFILFSIPMLFFMIGLMADAVFTNYRDAKIKDEERRRRKRLAAKRRRHLEK